MVRQCRTIKRKNSSFRAAAGEKAEDIMHLRYSGGEAARITEKDRHFHSAADEKASAV
jgi:hypothetical protein